MPDPQAVAKTLENTFSKIHELQMRGLPLLNPEIRIQALGFQQYKGRIFGIIITPWMMNVVILPCEKDDWSQMELGHKQPHVFPAKTLKFMVNDVDGIGPCQTHSLYSPMAEFANHEHAVNVAQGFLEELMVENGLEEDKADEELLGRVMRGEDTPEVNLDEFDTIEPMQAATTPTRSSVEPGAKVNKKLSRRNLLLGRFR